MNGLLIKDWKLMRRQGFYFGAAIVVLGAIAFASSSKSYSSFVTSYLTFMISIFSFSSFGYDEYENGMEFLMALPSGRRDYVKAKYTFSFLLILGGWLAGDLLQMLLFLVRFSAAEYLEFLPETPVYLLLCMLYVGAALPALIWFGAEKGRNISFLVLAVLAFGAFMTAKSEVGLQVLRQMDRLADNGPLLLVLVLAAVCVLLWAVSFGISLKLIEKKEF